ncbi:MAG: hypothetical protein H0W72_01765 [Planctomycetes bacterium]|nr:hypothetical protein [Planctomycetota bacterium]
MPGRTVARSTRVPFALALVFALAFAIGCERASHSQASADERRLIGLLTTDPFILVDDQMRNERGELIVITRQGDTRVRYLLAGQPLAIHRIIDDIALSVGDDGTRGTGPEKRGIDR